MSKLSFLAIALATTALACGSDESSSPAEDPAEHACEHIAEAGTAVAAGADRAGAPALTIAEEPYTVTLLSGAPGFVKIEGPLEGLLFAGTADVVTALFHGDSTDDELPAASPTAFCSAEIPEHYDLDLHESGPFYVQLGPAQVPDVWLMLIDAGAHAH
jgi:hypothetical protein